MQTYEEYLSAVEFEDINLEKLSESKLDNLQIKQGVNILNGDSIELAIMHKFEPMSILNTVSIFEKVNEFIVLDPFGITMYTGTDEEVIQFVQGFYDDGGLI